MADVQGCREKGVLWVLQLHQVEHAILLINEIIFRYIYLVCSWRVWVYREGIWSAAE